jgi:predicted component of type VI protein secretion system
MYLMFLLYFPEDKTEYIPAFATMALFVIAAVAVWRLIIKISKKEEEKTKELEAKLKEQENKKSM